MCSDVVALFTAVVDVFVGVVFTGMGIVVVDARVVISLLAVLTAPKHNGYLLTVQLWKSNL